MVLWSVWQETLNESIKYKKEDMWIFLSDEGGCDETTLKLRHVF